MLDGRYLTGRRGRGVNARRRYLHTSLVHGLTTVLAVHQRPSRGFLNESYWLALAIGPIR